ncbi:related to Endoplasmic reticulum transmembrane protein 3 [Saccharomycodes ludwigii]|uniref:Endoplasmic reticulum transmembrane protein n=1 Tax=Saccharomycodes ludwigii TaxID=36035 RepID=A0A376B866_9ASCO|nr:hypothetical protein SCDLUD_004268 [Saccharomycodes ludwigii]KAH3899952.1 hypothetical protein SCDLUD_004268 [Saccharomycodes ludwigii]SSD60769.1 related to Endoplasmic reticulum transmembrane protein 3 [Saccharomycodes ludwigii]
MSLYFLLIFSILVTEMVFFILLGLPLPTKYRKPLTLLIIKPFRNQTVQVTIKCIIVFVFVLFADCVSKLMTLNEELYSKKRGEGIFGETTGGGGGGAFLSSGARADIYSRKFYAQRNMYLTGITLFLSLCVTRIFGLVIELLDLKAKYRKVDPTPKNSLSKSELLEEIKTLDDKIETLKTKSLNLQQKE